MALTLIVQTADPVEPGANVYDDLPAWVEYLTDHGYPSFISKTTAEQTRFAVEATEIGEDEVQNRATASLPCDQDASIQGLLFPRQGAYDRRGRWIDGLPGDRYRAGFFLLGERLAASTTGHLSLSSGNVKEERVDGWHAVYREEHVSFAQMFPDVWACLMTAFPAGLRQQRA